MAEVDIAHYIELYDKKNKLKQRIADHIGRQFFNIVRDYETEIGKIFSSTDPLRITGSLFKNAVESFIDDLNTDGDLRAWNGRQYLIEINNEIKDVLNFKYPIDYSLLAKTHQDSKQTLNEIQRIITDYRAGKMTEIRARRSVQGRLRVPAAKAITFINTQLAGFDNTSTQTIAGLAGLNKAAYYGPFRSGFTRIFCERLLNSGQLYTEHQIRAMDNHQGIPVIRYCGGYNCMHEWIWVDPDWGITKSILQR